MQQISKPADQEEPPTHRIRYWRSETGLEWPSGIEQIRKTERESLDLQNYEERVRNSYANATEIYHIMEGLKHFEAHRLFQEKTVSVICFYSQQAEQIKFTIEEIKESNPVLYAAFETRQLNIQTVDSAQGSEASIVILSGVRSNDKGQVGFLNQADGRKRICVGLSRACEALIIVGDKSTLACGNLAFSRLWTSEAGMLRPLLMLKTLSSISQLGAAGARSRQAAEAAVSDLFLSQDGEGGLGLSASDEAEDVDGDFM